MSDHSNDEKRKNIPDRNIQRMSKPNDESMGKRRPHTSEEEQLPEKIEKVTESLLSQWEISEDDLKIRRIWRKLQHSFLIMRSGRPAAKESGGQRESVRREIRKAEGFRREAGTEPAKPEG